MTSKVNRYGVRLGLALRQNRGALLFIAAWLLVNYAFFLRSFGMSRSTAALVAVCVSKASGGWPSIYQSFTEVVVFGVIASLVVTNVTRKYRPEETCRALAQRSSEHVVLAKTYRARAVSTSRLAAAFIQGQAQQPRARAVVVLGKNNVGERVAEALAEKRIPYSFVEVTDDVAELAAAGVAESDMVIVCDDDLGKNLVRVDRIRDLNKRTRIICRAFHDEAAEVLGRPPFDCVVLSTSKYASESLARAGAFRDVGITDVPERVARTMLATS